MRGLLATSAGLWKDLVERLPAEALERPAAVGEWSAADCLRHVLGSDRFTFPDLVQQFLDGREELIPSDTANWPPAPERTLAEVVEALGRMHSTADALIAGLAPDDLTRSARFPALGQVTLAEVLNQWAVHHLVHGTQAQRALLQGFLARTGQLRALTPEHDLEALADTAPSAPA